MIKLIALFLLGLLLGLLIGRILKGQTLTKDRMIKEINKRIKKYDKEISECSDNEYEISCTRNLSKINALESLLDWINLKG